MLPATPCVVTDIHTTDSDCPPGQRYAEVQSVITTVLELVDSPGMVADMIVVVIGDSVADRSLFITLPAGTVYVCKDVEPTDGPTATPDGAARHGVNGGSLARAGAANRGPDGADNMQATGQ